THSAWPRERKARFSELPPASKATSSKSERPDSTEPGRRLQPRNDGVLSGVVDVRHDLFRRLRASSRLTLAIVEFELSWAPNVLPSVDYPYRERHGEALYRFNGGMLPSDFFRRNPGSESGAGFVLSFQVYAIGIRLPPPFPPPLAGEGQGGAS